MAEKRIRSKKYIGVYILKQNNGDISYSILYKNAEAKNQREAIGLKSEGISELYAYNQRIERINQVKHGETPTTIRKNKNTIRFEEIWEHYIFNKALSENIRKDYQGRWKKHMEHDFHETISLNKLISFRNRLRKIKKPLSERSMDMMVSMLGSATKYWNSRLENSIKIHDHIADLRVYDKDHTTRKERKERNIKRERYLEKKEIDILKQYIETKHSDLLLFINIALSTGARLGAIMKIKYKNIKGNKISLVDEKNGHERYTAYLNLETLEILQNKLSSLEPNEEIFELTQYSLQKKLQRILNKLFNQGLATTDRANRVVIHTLRHTFASQLVMQGTSLTIVQKLLNHSDLDTTARYAHLAPNAGQDAVLNLWN